MSNYTKVTNFTAKDSLPSGNTGKVVRGSEIDTEFSNIQTAVNSKADTASPTFTGTVTIPTAAITGGSITGITDLAIADGGTGASTAQNARNNLLPSQSTHAGKYLKTDGTDVSWDALDISTADITGTLPIANGGTGATSASAARTALGLAIGTDVQAYDAQLADVAGLTPTDDNFIVGNGTNFVTESGATARTSLGLGSIATQAASNVAITGGSISGITDLAVADGGTGASNASGARTNLGLVIGTDVQAYDAELAAIAGLTSAADKVPYFTGSGTAAVADFTSFGRSIVDDADASAARTTLGLGSIATQAANNVNITGGSVTGITDLAVADGGTGASTAANARVNLLPSYTGNGSKVLALNSGATDVEWTTNGNGTVTSVDMTVPTGLAVSGNPITSSGTLAVSFASGYSIPTTTKQGNWDTAYGWGDHSTAGYAKYGDTTANFTGTLQQNGSNVLKATDIGSSVQAYDAQLADVAGLTPTDNGVIIGNGSNFVVESGATLKTSLGLTIGTDVQAYDSNLTSFVNAFTLPTTDGTTGQALTTNGSGTISWSTVAGAPGGSNTQLQYNNSGAFAGASGLVTDGTNLTLNGQADLRFADSDSSNWVAFQAPATIASNVTWTLPNADGTSGQFLSTDGSGTLSWATASGGGGSSITAGDSKVEVTDTGSNGTITFTTDNSERMRINSSGSVGIGTSSPSTRLHVSSGDDTRLTVTDSGNNTSITIRADSTNEIYSNTDFNIYTTGSNPIIFKTNNSDERARIAGDGTFFIGKTATTLSTAGTYFYSYGEMGITRNASNPLLVNRTSNDGTLVEFYQDSTLEGTISVSGNTVSYNGFSGGHWSQLQQGRGYNPEILRGTVMSTIGEMCEWKSAVWDEVIEHPAVAAVEAVEGKEATIDEEGNVIEPAVEAVAGVEGKDAWTETIAHREAYLGNLAVGATFEEDGFTKTVVDDGNERLPKVKISDVVGDKAVYGVFQTWDEVQDMLVTSLGAFVVRIASGVTVEIGDLLESNGNGCAKVQDDDVIRSKTIGKVTSTTPTATYDDGSYTVPCVIYCG